MIKLNAVAEDVFDLDLLFKKPELTSYGFIRLFFAELTKQHVRILDRNNISSKIYTLSNNPKYQHLFSDIGFRVNIDSICSQDIEDGLSSLQTFGMIGKLNPSYDKIVIYIREDIADEIIKEYDNSISNMMKELVSDYIKLKA